MNQYRMPETDGRLLELRGLMDLKVNGDDIRGFINSWDDALLAMRKAHPPDDPEMLLPRHIQRHPHLQRNMAYYERLPIGHDERN